MTTNADEQKNDTAPLIRSHRIPRVIRIDERNNPPAPNTFDTSVTYHSSELPEWFAPLQSIIEDDTFTDMMINLGNKVRYYISVANAECTQ